MRRLTRLVDALGTSAGLPVLAALLGEALTQEGLLAAMEDAGVQVNRATLSGLMTRFEDLGLVERDNQRAAYRLQHRDAAAAALLHLAALGREMAARESEEIKELETLARKARIDRVEGDEAGEQPGG